MTYNLPPLPSKLAETEMAGRIKRAPSLEALLDALRAFEDAYPDDDDDGWPDPGTGFDRWTAAIDREDVDMCNLPTFGIYDGDTMGVWSWDEHNLLVGEGSSHCWHIKPRTDQ